MYIYQAKRLLKRFCGLVIAIIVFMTAVAFVKNYYLFNSIPSSYYGAQTSGCLDELIQGSRDLSLDEMYGYIYDFQNQQSEDYQNAAASNESINNKSEAASLYIQSLEDAYIVNGVIEYSKTGSGLVSANIPIDLTDNRAFYASLDPPTVVNEQPFFNLLELLSVNLTPIYIMLLVGFFSADDYEKGIHRMVNISYNSSLFYRSREVVLSLSVFLIYTLNFAIDLLLSGAAFQSEYLDATIQSTIMFMPLKATIFGTIVWLYLLGLLHAYICSNLFMVFAQKSCSMKLYLTLSGGLIIICSAASTYFTDISQYLFFGISNKTYMLWGIRYFSVISCSEATVSVIAALIALAALIIYRVLNRYRLVSLS